MTQNGNNYLVNKEEGVFDVMSHVSGNSNVNSVENLVAIHSRRAIFKNKSFFKKASIGLLILFLVFLIAFIIILVFYIESSSELARKNVCMSKECIRTASNFKLSMDTSVNPCEDFYKYSCGHWSEEHPNHGWYPSFSNFELIDERVLLATLNFLQTNNSDQDPVPVKQARMLHQSCMNKSEIDKLSFTVMHKYLKEAGLPLVPNYLKTDKVDNQQFDWISADVQMKKLFDMDLFIGFVVDMNIYNTSTNVMYIGSPSASSPLPLVFNPKPTKSQFSRKRPSLQFLKKRKSNRRYFEAKENSDSDENSDDDDEDQSLKESVFHDVAQYVIKEYMSNSSAPLPDDSVILNASKIIWNIKTQISELSNVNETEDVLQLKISELQNRTNIYLQSYNEKPIDIWRDYVNKIFKDIPKVKIDFEKDLLYTTEEEIGYMLDMVYLISKTSAEILELYTWWSAVETMVTSTSTKVVDYIKDKTSVLKSYQTVRLRSLYCSSIVINFMGIAVSYGIAQKNFLNSTKPKVEEMLSNIKLAFVNQVEQTQWMDSETKRSTLEKSKEMMSFIGFPDWLMNKTELERHYKNIKIQPDTYMDNMMSFVKMYYPAQLSSLRKMHTRSWIVDPTTVNAFNYFSVNSIYVPMAILTFPMYDLGLEVLNYGAIGSILGHELTHGFDNSGRLYDQFGNHRQWWSNNTIETFVNKTKCFIDQYDNFVVPSIDMHVKGEETLGENIADNGGLNHAFWAYNNYLNTHGPDMKLPGFENYTDEQMFFIAYGSIWCEEFKPAAIKQQILTDPHSPSEFRVMGTLQNSPEFSRAFHCPIGSKMNPKRNRCRIW